MKDEQVSRVAAAGLVIGALLGMAGSFAPTTGLRGLAWGTDGIALVVGSALLGPFTSAGATCSWRRGFLYFWRARR